MPKGRKSGQHVRCGGFTKTFNMQKAKTGIDISRPDICRTINYQDKLVAPDLLDFVAHKKTESAVSNYDSLDDFILKLSHQKKVEDAPSIVVRGRNNVEMSAAAMMQKTSELLLSSDGLTPDESIPRRPFIFRSQAARVRDFVVFVGSAIKAYNDNISSLERITVNNRKYHFLSDFERRLFEERNPSDQPLEGTEGENLSDDSSTSVSQEDLESTEAQQQEVQTESRKLLTEFLETFKIYALPTPFTTITYAEAFTALMTNDDPDYLASAIFNYYGMQLTSAMPFLTPAVIEATEWTAFCQWRDKVSNFLRSIDHKVEFERNLVFWRELWRTIDSADVVTLVLDARTTRFCFNLAFKALVEARKKKMFVLVNKADFLSSVQRKLTFEWFNSKNVECGLYSSIKSCESGADYVSISACENWDFVLTNDELIAKYEMLADQVNEMKKADELISIKLASTLPKVILKVLGSQERFIKLLSGVSAHLCDVVGPIPTNKFDNCSIKSVFSSLFGQFADETKFKLKVGFVGFPNVGKSSVINSLLNNSGHVSVSSTPGKTKHIQSISIPNTAIELIDCPGLVLPVRAASREELVIYGVLNIDRFNNSCLQVLATILLRIGNQLVEVYQLEKRLEADGIPTDSLGLSNYAFEFSQIVAEKLGLFKAGKGKVPDSELLGRKLIKNYIKGQTYSYCEPCVAQSSHHNEDIKKWELEERLKWISRRKWVNSPV